jgi:hypothetical protein
MTALTFTSPSSAKPSLTTALTTALRGLPHELRTRERRLAIYAAILLALLLPMALAGILDDRLLRGAGVWLKPMKFALSIALLALTTAWFAGHLPARGKRRLSTTLVSAG